MRYSLIFCVSLLVGFFIIPATAQKQLSKIGTDFNQPSAKKIDESIRCYTMEMDAIRRNQNNQLPSLQQQEVLFQKLLRDYKNGKSGKGENINKATLLTIPCIFHIITDGAGAEDISAAQVQAQVNQLNIDFRNLAGSNDPAAADVEIEFCLAILDPSDNLLPEQGINRVTAYGEGPFNTGFIDATIKPGTFWNPDEYMNVWVADITGGILGYAQFPSNSGLGGLNANGGAASTDGVVHLYSTIGSVANPFPGGAPYNLGRTMTHEVGHWLGLRHIWGDANCGNDFCGDTPQSQTSNFGCPNLTTCDGNQDMVENYMDYTNDACMDIFTADQKDRIRTVMLNSPRRALLPLSEKCGLPQPTISFVNPDGGTINEGVNCDFIDIPLELEISLPATEDATVTFTLGGNTTATQGVDFDITPSSILFPGNSTINQTFVITIYNDAILENNEIIELQINVTTIGDAVVSNTQGIYTLTILDANFVAANILFENFEGGALGNFTAQGAAGSDLFQNGNTNNASSQFWIIEPTNTTQFAFTNDDACDCDKSNDFLTSPVFSLVGYTGNVFLTFDHAFAAETYETAEVQINTGAGWNPISTLTNTSVNNANTLTTPWVNGNSLDLTVYVGQANVQIRFTYNDGGQWAYGLAIDNIRIYTDSPLLSTNLSGIDTQSSCSSYTWLDGNTYTTSNNSATYTIVAGASNGCDSLVTLNLMLNNASIGTDVLASCTPITWIDGNTYTVSNNTATFNIIGGAASACDSIVTLDLTINSPTTGTDVLSSCTPITWIDGNTYTTSNNTATFNIIGGAASGCDSIATLDLTINNTVLGTDTQVACESYIWIDGNTYTTSNNTAIFNIIGGAASGCDSIVTLDLTINSPTTGTDVLSSCTPITWIDGNTYTTSNNTATFNILDGATSGCDSLVTLDLTIGSSVNGTDVLASCTPFTWIDGNTYTTSNNTATFNIIGGAASGCDSIATLDLTINNTVLGTDTQVACESYIWIDGITYTASNNVATFNIANGAANGCDSIVTLDLTINSSSSMVLTETFDSGTITGANAPVLYGNGGSDFNQSYPISGTFFGWFNVQNGIGDVDIYERNLTNLTVGCTVTLSVWVRSTIPISDITMTLTDDNGSITSLLNPTLSGSWQLVTMTTTVTTNGLNFLVHYNSTGGNGLDVMMEDLTITQECGINAVINPVNDQCLGTNIFTFDGSSSISSAGVSSYSWDFGDASALSSAPNPIHTYLLAGAYDVILNISDGACLDDTTITVNVYASPIADAPLDIVACDFYALTPLSGGSYYSMTNGAGINYNIGDNITTSQSMYVFAESNTIPNCIDENTFMITINDSQSNIDSHISCGPFTWVDGITYTTSNNIANYTYTNGTSLGCDSTVTLDLTINTPATGTDVIASCAPITWIDGNTYTTSNNTSTFNLAGGATNGCDSLVSLDLTISNEVNGVDNQIACASFTWIDGITYTQSNNLATFTYTGGAVAGCDSIVTLNLTVNNPVITTDVQTSCDSYTWIDGNTYTEDNNTASYTYSGAAANTCDSIVNLNLTITYTASGTDFQTACDSYTWIDGNTYTASNNSATMNINGGATNGCDSIVTLNLIINNSVTSIDSQSACITFNWIDGNTYTQSNNTATFIISGGTINGCDSTVTLNLTINSLTTLDPGPDISVCEGQSVTPMAQGANTYSWDLGLNNGISFIPNLGTTEYTVTGTDINGCQSDASMIVNVNSQPSLDITSIDPLCAGDASGEINLEISDGTEPFTTLWSNDSNLNNQQNLFAGTFTVLVTDDEGCNEEGIVILSNPIEPCYELPDVYFYVPNSFTPDADEHNQNWFIVLSGVNEQTFTLNLYNRWGELIWESHDISAKWDGTYRGNSVPNGTYTWQIEYTRLNDGKRIFETGHLNVLR
ncbi:MAG: gliding motility-associated C-terminal domain-containing protein [Crocinitomicaceae bacterium]